MYHKFQHRETLQPVYFSEAGKAIFQRDAESKKYNYIGTVTEEEKLAEEQKALEVPKEKPVAQKAKKAAATVIPLTEEEQAKKDSELSDKNEKILEEEEANRLAEEKRQKDVADLKDGKAGHKK